MNSLRSKIAITAAVLLAAALPVLAGPFPSTVSYDGSAVDAAGQPLAGTYDMTFRYFGKDGSLLLTEQQAAVAVADGRFHVELGTGKVAADGPGLEGVFAANPEVQLEVAMGDTVYEPRVGILPAGHSLKSRLVAAGLRSQNDQKEHWRGYEVPSGGTAVQATLLAPLGSRPAAPVAEEGKVWRRPYELPVEGPMLSIPVRDLPVITGPQETPPSEAEEINTPRHESLYDQNGNLFGTVAPRQQDPLAGAASAPGETPALDFDFEGINNINGVLPPDTEATVGMNHYIQVVNLSFAIYDKSGTLVSGPVNTNSLWSGFGGVCQSQNNGDAIFMYDNDADRYVLAQFAVQTTNTVCFAVSQTSDPTGSYFLYSFVTPRFPDYFKLGVWPDPANSSYFMGTNSGFQGQYDVFAIDRDNMLAGSPARPIQVFQSFPNLIMPADLDGPVNPPAGSPGMLYSFRDGGEPYFFNPPDDSIDLYEFDVDWPTPGNTTFTLAQVLDTAAGLAPFNWTVCGFFVSNCIPQPGTAQGIDSASWWPMQRLIYRNFGDHETLVGSWTVDVNPTTPNRAAPRWFELRRNGGTWSIFQQGTHSPDAIHRWMPSIAMDGDGNIAMGYSRGDGSNFPSIYYTVRETSDPLGTLQSEVVLQAGSGSQTHSAARWGDYSSMELDPADDCTFWYTNEYLQVTGSAPWRTHVGVFRIPTCQGATDIFADGFESGDTSAWTSTVG